MKPDTAPRAPWLAASGPLLRRLLHDLSQPLSLIRVVAQDIRIDINKDRLDPEDLPESMIEIEQAVDQIASFIDRVRSLVPKDLDEEAAEGCQLKAACEEAMALASSKHPQAKLRLSLEQSFSINIPHARLVQMIAELLEQGINQARRESEAELCLFAGPMGPWVGLCLSDGGTPADETLAALPSMATGLSEGEGGWPLALSLLPASKESAS